MQFRIGDRDPVTGLYFVIWPDGSQMLNGVKIFNAAHAVGDVVLATGRSDGMMILDSVKAATDVSVAVTREFGLQKFGEQPVGYLNGQVWNNEDEPILPIVSIEFAPSSPTELAPNAGNFVVRIKIDRPQRRDLLVKVELTGTAPSGDYTYTGLANNLMAVIPAGELFVDVTLTPTQNQSGSGETVIVTVIKQSTYKIKASAVTATIISVTFRYTISRWDGSISSGYYTLAGWPIVASGSNTTVDAYNAEWDSMTTGLFRSLPLIFDGFSPQMLSSRFIAVDSDYAALIAAPGQFPATQFIRQSYSN